MKKKREKTRTGHFGLFSPGVKLFRLSRPADLGAKAAATLRCASGGVPAASAAAAATEGPKGPRRQAGRSRGGRGSGTISRTCEKVTPENRESNGSGFYAGDSP